MRNRTAGPSIWMGVVAGVVGGLFASAVMEQFQSAWNAAAKRRGNGQRQSESSDTEPATVKVAEVLAESAFDRPLPEAAKGPAGEAVHYAFGSAIGAVYGALAEWNARTTVGRGLPFAAAVWLLADEIAVPASGLSKPPAEHPLSTHAYSLASHLVYGLTLDIVRRGVLAVAA
jgi:putative membrane protein